MWNQVYKIAPFIFATILFLIAITVLYLKLAFGYWKKVGVPYPKPSFPFGNVKSNFGQKLAQNIAQIYHDMKNASLDYCGYYLFTIPIFMPISPELIKNILAKNFQCFHDRGVFCDEENDSVTASLVNMEGQNWKQMRSKLAPTLTAGKNRMMFPIMKACTDELTNILEEASGKQVALDMVDLASRYTTDVIFSSIFGIQCNSLKNPSIECRKYGQKIFTNNFIANLRLGLAFSAPFVLKALKMSWLNPEVSNYFRNIITETVDYRETNKINRNDFINILIRLKNNENIEDDHSASNKSVNDSNAKPGLTIDQITAHCLIFFLAGYETSSQTIAFCMYELAVNQDVQDKVRCEIHDILDKHAGEITYDAIMKMQYLDKVFNETLRKFPSIHMLNRVCTKDYSIPNTNMVIRKGVRVAISILGIHSDPEYYPDPQRFDPERFSEEEIAKRPMYTYMPFGDGPRICTGIKFGTLQVKTCLIHMLNNYKFTLHPKVNRSMSTECIGNMLHPAEQILLLAHKI